MSRCRMERQRQAGLWALFMLLGLSLAGGGEEERVVRVPGEMTPLPYICVHGLPQSYTYAMQTHFHSDTCAHTYRCTTILTDNMHSQMSTHIKKHLAYTVTLHRCKHSDTSIQVYNELTDMHTQVYTHL